MGFPKLKHPRLCRILTYVVVIGGFLLPTIVTLCIPSIPDSVQVITFFLCILALLAFLLREFPILMTVDLALASLSCVIHARKQYPLPQNFHYHAFLRRISRFGTEKEPAPLLPHPNVLRYRFNASMTIFSSGIERIVMAYHTDYLDMETYRAIFSSARTNAKRLTGSKKALFLDRQQKNAPINQVSVIFILAKAIDPRLSPRLYDEVCKQAGDGFDLAYLPCILDLQQKLCFCDSVCLPYLGFQYPVKNRGIRLIRRMVFGGRFPLKGNPHCVQAPGNPFTQDTTLWEMWRTFTEEWREDKKETVKQFKRMADGEIYHQKDGLYCKWGEQGVLLMIQQDTNQQVVAVEKIENWTYPKSRPISKKTIAAMETALECYFSKLGYAVQFKDIEDLL